MPHTQPALARRLDYDAGSVDLQAERGTTTALDPATTGPATSVAILADDL